MKYFFVIKAPPFEAEEDLLDTTNSPIFTKVVNFSLFPKMRLFSRLSCLAFAGAIPSFAASSTQSSSASASTATSGCALTSADTTLLEYAYAISDFATKFYAAVPVNSSLASAISNVTSTTQALANLQGLEISNNLTLEAIRELGSQAPGFSAPDCTFTYPSVSSVFSFARWAYQLENTLTGAFVGAAGYTKSPEVAFLLARLAAEHSAHATWVGSRVNSTIFPPNANALVAAYTPEQVLNQTSNATGSLGMYIGDCVSAPAAPCGTLVIGPLEANLTSSSSIPSSTGAVSSTPFSSGSSSTASASSSASSST